MKSQFKLAFFSIAFFSNYINLCPAAVKDEEMGMESPREDNLSRFRRFFNEEQKTLDLNSQNITDEEFKSFCKDLAEFINTHQVKKLLMEDNKFVAVPSELIAFLSDSDSLQFVSLNRNLIVDERELMSIIDVSNGFSLEQAGQFKAQVAFKQIVINDKLILICQAVKRIAPHGRNYRRAVARLSALFLLTLIGHGIQLAGFYLLKESGGEQGGSPCGNCTLY